MTNTLFEIEPTKTSNTLTIRCSGCPSTATIEVRASRRGDFVGPIPDGWVATGSDAQGRLLKWCRQCAFERRYERSRQQAAVTA